MDEIADRNEARNEPWLSLDEIDTGSIDDTALRDFLNSIAEIDNTYEEQVFSIRPTGGEGAPEIFLKIATPPDQNVAAIFDQLRALDSEMEDAILFVLDPPAQEGIRDGTQGRQIDLLTISFSPTSPTSTGFEESVAWDPLIGSEPQDETAAADTDMDTWLV